VKDQYVGDIGDFEKYSLLRALQRASGLPLVVCWMLTRPDATGEGAKTDYLAAPKRYRHLEPHVFDSLRELVLGGSRSTGAVEAAAVFEGAVFLRRQLLDDLVSRRALLEDIHDAAANRPSLVFFDPDIGIAPKSVRKGGKRSSMYLFHDELTAVFAGGHSLVVYQHFAREPRVRFLSRTFDEIRAHAHPASQFAVYSGRVAFLVLAQATAASSLRAAADQVVRLWAPRLTLWAEDDLARHRERVGA
jgi:hypothetical protein